jgi:hypothetical protein
MRLGFEELGVGFGEIRGHMGLMRGPRLLKLNFLSGIKFK